MKKGVIGQAVLSASSFVKSPYLSWSMPWLAGMYVLAKQVSLDITPEEFWDTALKTSDESTNNDTGTYIGRLINPKRLIAELQKSAE